MTKELVISIIIVILIFIGDYTTKNYTKESVQTTIQDLKELRLEMMNEDITSQNMIDKIELIHQKWDDIYEKLAYYIEHDELEKVETELTGIKSYIDKEEYTEAVAEVDKSMYILEHIKDKSDFNLKNIF